ncbi:hypothetical protein EDF58_101582 [Novosphingobium sp. PhB57]|uniref:hypothetical protein n=1 Tax=Novosphingobium sp. PhB57 TaxID=2485107 RepID=UPI00104BCE9C|nr:hypothetical protein [Novosphingobium sp. PhB57]TCU61268.1 hypothetical protein EDF58_101582 [Novosphingobium sp. PhB57]
MRIVIDSNCMQSDELREFLADDYRNKAVLTDYAAMEAFKGNTLVSVKSSWEVLGDFPDQIVVLKGTREAALIDPRAPGMGNRMQSRSETKGARDFGRLLNEAEAGHRALQAQLMVRGKWADHHMDSMLAKAGSMHLSIAEFSAVFTESELRRIRRDDEWTESMSMKFLDLVMELTINSFNAHPDQPRQPRGKHWPNHFLYRHTLTYLVYMTRLAQRGAVTRKANSARNDAVDVIFATFATYFDGLMTADQEASAVHHISRALLTQIGARVSKDYLERYSRELAES